MEYVIRVSFDKEKEVIASRIEQINDSWDVVAAVTHSFTATQQMSPVARDWQPNTFPDQAGAAYWIREMTVERNMLCSDVVGVPRERSTRRAYSTLEPDEKSTTTYSAAENLFTMTPMRSSILDLIHWP